LAHSSGDRGMLATPNAGENQTTHADTWKMESKT